MTPTELARLLDHSVLKPEATDPDIRAGAEVVRRRQIGFYCVQPCWVRLALASLGDVDSRVVSVIAFPHGCDRPAVKARAASIAVSEGAREIDMVMNFGALKSGDAILVAEDIEAVVRAVPGIPVKVILEMAALAESEKHMACRLASDAGAAFIKTSTGFHPSGGATLADVRLMRAAAGPAVGVKASGGIRNLGDTLEMLAAGASRIGTSASEIILDALELET
jgi:deoxyribose-phosphate aldolase